MLGSTAIYTAKEVYELRQDNSRLSKAKSELKIRNQQLINNSNKLERQLVDQKRIISQSTKRIANRSVRSTVRSTAAIPIESVPIIGISTIIATTAWEIRDTCQTLEDMSNIERSVGLEPDTTVFSKVCQSTGIQSARALHYGKMRESECRLQAKSAKERIYELARETSNTIDNEDLNDIDYQDEILQSAEEEFQAINKICDCIADLACNPNTFAP